MAGVQREAVRAVLERLCATGFPKHERDALGLPKHKPQHKQGHTQKEARAKLLGLFQQCGVQPPAGAARQQPDTFPRVVHTSACVFARHAHGPRAHTTTAWEGDDLAITCVFGGPIARHVPRISAVVGNVTVPRGASSSAIPPNMVVFRVRITKTHGLVAGRAIPWGVLVNHPVAPAVFTHLPARITYGGTRFQPRTPVPVSWPPDESTTRLVYGECDEAWNEQCRQRAQEHAVLMDTWARAPPCDTPRDPLLEFIVFALQPPSDSPTTPALEQSYRGSLASALVENEQCEEWDDIEIDVERDVLALSQGAMSDARYDPLTRSWQGGVLLDGVD